ncbi:preprotein translocase subunit SecG [Vagococcus lutrae]|uniref:Protein-export membrane protein SecG n=2 Tax=Vagococcus lutrae TaxID=81947 RepID=V6Q5X7_9ENTE|nr:MULTISPECIES: preprotein translocase subunit SecG [Vagococcus]EST90626.1 preprotein translocase, SecG subunit [Vagococcus lutrae LBD1]MCO7151628.1 preprotein translocase subunit SecG [Vagococcus lutrae]MDO5742411.1 preprotein translocase subunit SecG [Vagococcus sp.]MDT2802448.1 preprotein translocase subunit SecG [Vagococcus lutrae]MDT2806944.1 preprotein translocase subunit SecG [Vagococcus lutrae]
MYSFLITLMIILSLLIIVAVMMQPSKQNSAASAFTGGADQLFGKQKARGFEAVMQRITTVLAIAWVVVAILLAYLPLA